ncbi:MAG: DUF805 domain-containing protein [Leptolyngbyaceae cyanobacterium MO_188.B28]|nr:DUF805 domain-containing protein [Leptolyngbyaceae cyanobacterium MO_188.B28]
MEWYLKVLRKYAVFGGRARRKEYWYFVLFNFIVALVLGVVDNVLGTNGLLGFVYMLGVFIPGLAVAIRRLHDTGRSGWWLLIGFVPIIGFIVLIVFLASGTEPGKNQYDVEREFA